MQKPKKHVMSMTYGPKIKPVQDGECAQSIRKGSKYSVGDSVLLHGWSGIAYRSGWNGRMRLNVIAVGNIKISKAGIHFTGKITGFKYVITWDDERLNELAAADFIDPPTGEGLRGALFKSNEIPEEPEDYQVIIWEIDEVETAKLGKIEAEDIIKKNTLPESKEINFKKRGELSRVLRSSNGA